MSRERHRIRRTTTDPVREVVWDRAGDVSPDRLLAHEWLVTNGLGGYASGTVSGAHTRRYHGLLVAALSAPLGRTVMLSHLSEVIRTPEGTEYRLGAREHADGSLDFYGADYLSEFRLEMGLPVWCFRMGKLVLEKRILMPYRQNTVHVGYRLSSGNGAIRLELRPSVHFRSHDAPVNEPLAEQHLLTAMDDRYELSAGPDYPPLRLLLHGGRAAFTTDPERISEVFFRVEEIRGYEPVGSLWSPGYFSVDLAKDQEITLVASAEGWEVVRALDPKEALAAERERRDQLLTSAHPKARVGMGAELVLAADQFVIAAGSRVEDVARAHARSEEVRTVLAGYHWFNAWGRDTMISLEGLTLTAGRYPEARYILLTFARYIRDGLIPNMFPESGEEGRYNTADATLWFFHAIDRYLEATGDRETLRILLPKLLDIVDHHLKGTRFGIHVDPSDGLLHQGEEGVPLTWMDAHVGDWVVTPRRGKAVEINALWYNALRLLERWVREERGEESAKPLAEHAERARQSFNRRFWNEEEGHLYDVVDGEKGDDPACRPNQLFAIALPHPVLHRDRWEPVLRVVLQRLVTPVGLRSLAPGHPDYRPQYFGDPRTRDEAYHQGTVWPWLIGPFVDAWLKLHPEDRAGARRFLEGFTATLGEAGLGTIGEVFDAESPFTPRGCTAQAWSVAEVLRIWVKTG